MNLSIIIPTLNEEENISKLLVELIATPYNKEIVVVDGGSTDKTIEIVKGFTANNKVKLLETNLQSRAKQMNEGAKNSTGDVYYFVHADVMPPLTFYKDIEECIQSGDKFGCYRFKFDEDTNGLNFNAYFTRFDRMFCRGGDQTMFVTKEFFAEMNQFDEEYIIMEDFDFIRRARRKAKLKIMAQSVVVSSRKYDHNSYLKVNWINLTSYWMFMLGRHPQKIRNYYKKNLTMKY